MSRKVWFLSIKIWIDEKADILVGLKAFKKSGKVGFSSIKILTDEKADFLVGLTNKSLLKV